jgi:hypothetical protein
MSKDDKGGFGIADEASRRSAGIPAFPPDRAYVAFELRDNAERLHIVRATQPSRHPGYHYLADISEDHFHQSAFTLIYTFMIVEVTAGTLRRSRMPSVSAIASVSASITRTFTTRPRRASRT